MDPPVTKISSISKFWGDSDCIGSENVKVILAVSPMMSS